MYHCELCGRAAEEFGDVYGAIVCLDCMTNDPVGKYLTDKQQAEFDRLIESYTETDVRRGA